MTLGAGTRLGAYEIAAEIGAGGMGVVYRARDTKLGRDVALKVIPDAFALDPDRLARFKREAQLLASLNHPNIAAIYGFEEAPSDAGAGFSRPVRALVLELVEGPTLADRIKQGPIPLDEALAIASQVADALDAAHERGIVHRDLKPANIKLRDDGTVKVLDFGLAKALESENVAADLSMSPTMSVAATRMGVILGTAAYMAPEQARGKAVDRRADIWAFGCVLYEMLTGKRAFEGEEASDTLAAILRGEPDWSRVPAHLQRLLRACLEKDRKQRLQAVADYRLLLQDAASSGRGGSVWRERFAWAMAIAFVGVAITVGVLAYRNGTSSASVPEMRLQIATPPEASIISFALSPDGSKLVFASRGQLWLRPLGSESAQPLMGTEGAGPVQPFWSPDGRSIGFFSRGQLRRIDLDTGLVRALAGSPLAVGGAWGVDGTILFGPSPSSPLMRGRVRPKSGRSHAPRSPASNRPSVSGVPSRWSPFHISGHGAARHPRHLCRLAGFNRHASVVRGRLPRESPAAGLPGLHAGWRAAGPTPEPHHLADGWRPGAGGRTRRGRA